MLGETIRDLVPRGARTNVSVKLRPDSRIIIERAHANGDLFALRPVAAEKAGTARLAKCLHRSLPFAVNPDELGALEQLKLLLLHPRLGADSGAGMLPATIAMTMARSQKRREDLEPHSATETTAGDRFRHLFPLPSIQAMMSAAFSPSYPFNSRTIFPAGSSSTRVG